MFAYCRNNPQSRTDGTGTIDDDAKEEFEALLEEYVTIYQTGLSIDIESDPERWNNWIQSVGVHEAYDYMAKRICEKYHETYGIEFLFSDACVSYEIEYHVDAFMCMKGYSEYERNITTYIMSRKKLLNSCGKVDIFYSDVNTWKQKTWFDYYNGIRECYKKTAKDPFYHSRKSIFGWEYNYRINKVRDGWSSSLLFDNSN